MTASTRYVWWDATSTSTSYNLKATWTSCSTNSLLMTASSLPLPVVVVSHPSPQLPAPVTYPGPLLPPNPPRGFNLYLSAFDLLTAFTKEAHAAGVRQGDFVRLPVELFVTWLILKSAEFDGVSPPEGTPKALAFTPRARCLACGRFVTRQHAALSFPYCGTLCLEQRQGKLG